MNKKKKPCIRFKGFTDDWEQHKLGELVIIERGGSPRPIENYITNAEDGLNWVKIGDAPSQGRYITHTTEKIKPTGLSKTRQVEPGDLILSNSMSFGKPYIMAISGCIHDGWLLIRNNQNIFDLKFLCHMLGINQMTAQYKAMAAGSTVNNLNKSLVSNSVITIPSKTEQRKIGALLESLDDVIALHQRKCEKLKIIKKSMLENCFPKNGQKVPKIRFSGFTGDWEQRKLGDIVQITMGQSPNGETYSEKPSDYILVQGMADLKVGWVFPRVWTTQKTKTCDAGDLIMSVRAPAGAVGKTAYSAVIGRGVSAIKGNEFIYQTLTKRYLDGCWKKIAAGSTFESINFSAIADAEIMLPSGQEQKRIGRFFSNLDYLITLHQSKLEKLQKIKKSMLERMFV